MAALREAGFTVVNWNLSASPILSRPRLLRIELARIRPGTIVLLHDGGGNRAATVAALSRLIHALADRGYRFTTP